MLAIAIAVFSVVVVALLLGGHDGNNTGDASPC